VNQPFTSSSDAEERQPVFQDELLVGDVDAGRLLGYGMRDGRQARQEDAAQDCGE
jgi:hypothetical protein